MHFCALLARRRTVASSLSTVGAGSMRDADNELYSCFAFGEFLVTGGADCTLRIYGPEQQ